MWLTGLRNQLAQRWLRGSLGQMILHSLGVSKGGAKGEHGGAVFPPATLLPIRLTVVVAAGYVSRGRSYPRVARAASMPPKVVHLLSPAMASAAHGNRSSVNSGYSALSCSRRIR